MTHKNNRTKRPSIAAIVLLLCTGVAVGTATALPPIDLGIGTGAGTFDGRTVGELNISGGVRTASWLDVQLSGTAVHTMERSYTDGHGKKFQSEVGWMGLGLRPFVTLGERVEIGIPIRSAHGIVQLRYERPYRDDLRWTDEIIDREEIVVNSAGIDIRVAFNSSWSLTVEAGGRVSSPIRMVTAVDRTALNGWYAGIGTVYRLNSDL